MNNTRRGTGGVKKNNGILKLRFYISNPKMLTVPAKGIRESLVYILYKDC